MKNLNTLAMALLMAGLMACGGNQQSTEGAADSTATHTDHANHGDSTSQAAADTLQGKGAYAELRPDQSVFFKNIKDGDVLTSPFKVEMGVNGMEVEPAGYVNKDKGHHHLFINQGPTPKLEAIPMNDSTRMHFGKGQTETELNLPPGKYQLTMQFADGFHQSYGPQMSKTVNIEVKAGKKK